MAVRLSSRTTPRSIQESLGIFVVRGIVCGRKENYAATFVEGPKELKNLCGSPMLFVKYRGLKDHQKKRLGKNQRIALALQNYALDRKACRATAEITLESPRIRLLLDGTALVGSNMAGPTSWVWPRGEESERQEALEKLILGHIQEDLDFIPGEKKLELRPSGVDCDAEDLLLEVQELALKAREMVKKLRSASHPELIWLYDKPKMIEESSILKYAPFPFDLPYTLQLPSGGNVIVDKTAASWTFDVNTACCRETKHISAGERCNNEACEAIACFMYEHDIYGQVMIDFVGESSKELLDARVREISVKLARVSTIKSEAVLSFNVALIARGY